MRGEEEERSVLFTACSAYLTLIGSELAWLISHLGRRLCLRRRLGKKMKEPEAKSMRLKRNDSEAKPAPLIRLPVQFS